MGDSSELLSEVVERSEGDSSRRPRRFGLYAATLLAGLALGFLGASAGYHRGVWSKLADVRAQELGFAVRNASYLRLEETEPVLEYMELLIDSHTLRVARKPARLTRAQYRALQSAKAYRELYPTSSELRSQVNEALQGIREGETAIEPLRRLIAKRPTTE